MSKGEVERGREMGRRKRNKERKEVKMSNINHTTHDGW